ncbi:alpha/beta fold hydrolase [Telmatospirillum sp. J64-1]|uniref:alpha/beta fold hydrolase n=1 Tax=Telmatospirillum sp. J64-1 TaxID=2502183 RepID=UPI00115C947D|nr:alpha/beta fold hydrolase [Telmatospirillum sp. J64-1]
MSETLSYLEFGESGKPLVVLHGLFGSARNWSAIGRSLGAKRKIYALDLRNHGNSPWHDDMSYEAMAEDVAAFARAHSLGRIDLLGHSMGGKAAMMAALRHPDLIDRLIVADVAPVTYNQVFLSYAKAMKGIDLTGLTRRSEVESQLVETVPEAGVRMFLLQNLVSEDGKLFWRVNLDALMAWMDRITSFPEVEGQSFNAPALFLHGGNSDYVRPEYRPLILRLFPQARFSVIPGAGHWLHAEKPQDFTTEVERFLA